MSEITTLGKNLTWESLNEALWTDGTLKNEAPGKNLKRDKAAKELQNQLISTMLSVVVTSETVCENIENNIIERGLDVDSTTRLSRKERLRASIEMLSETVEELWSVIAEKALELYFGETTPIDGS